MFSFGCVVWYGKVVNAALRVVDKAREKFNIRLTFRDIEMRS